jgi:hypothetical protein
MLDLQQLIEQLPATGRQNLDEAFDRAAAMVERRGKIFDMIQEAFAEIRLDMRCLTFDLEVTRRERDRLQALLDSRSE